MIRIAALNDSSSEVDGDDFRAKTVGTREAEESEAYTLYNKALGLQRQDIQKAEEAFEQLLSHGFIREAAKLVETETVGIVHPGLQLLYSIYKNLATMSLQKGDHEEAMEWYIEAVKVDESETTVWYKIGTIALKLHNYQLARLGFEQGLQCNPNHWPCLDNIITVLYTINDYWYCLYYISKALKKDYLYLKGIVFRNQIFKEQPSLRDYTKEMFKDCNSLIDTEKVDQEDIDEFINEAMTMRQKRKELAKTPPMKPNKLPVPIKSYTWIAVGESLIALYNTIKKSNPPMSMGIRVDLSDYAEDQDKRTEIQMKEKQNQQGDTSSSSEVPPQPTPQQPPEENAPPQSSENKEEVSKSIEDNVEIVPSEAMEVDETPSIKSETIVTSLSNTAITDAVIISSTVTIPTSSEITVVTSVSSCENVIYSRSTVGQESTPPCSSTMVTEDPGVLLSPPTSAPSTPDVFNSCTPLSSIPISVTSALQDNPGSETSDTEGKNKGQKRKRSSNFDSPFYEKRRSARVRNTFTRREEERVNFREILETFIPSTLRPGADEEEMDTLDLVSENEESVFSKINTIENSTASKAKSLSETEASDVREFLQREQKNGGVLMLMLHFMESLCDPAELSWPQELASVYVKVYTRWRKHVDLPCLLSKDEPDEDIRSFGKMLLLRLELQFDQWLTKHLKSGASPKGKSPGSAVPSEMPWSWEEDMDYVFGLQGQSQVLGSLWLQHCVRAFWLQARLCLLQGEIQYASCSFHKAKEFLKWRIEDENVHEILLKNCQSDNWIAIESIERHQNSLERSQCMDEMQKLYDAQEYDQVVELLLKAVTHPSQKPMRKESDSIVPARIEQLCLLYNCLVKMGDVKRSMHWGEIAFHEAFQGYKKATTSPHKDEWSNVLNQIWSLLLTNLEKPESLKDLSGPRKMRLTSDLMAVIDIMMSVPEKATDMPIGSVLPWMILYSVIQCEEKEFFDLQKEQELSAQNISDSMPSSLMLLNVSHDYLGSHSWCTKSNGKFLIFFMDVLQRKMTEPLKYTDDLRQMYEQCVYCLYGHPNKKGRAKHLADHNCPPISLTLQQAIKMFEYFKPKNLPEFDSFKTDTVSAELESLLRRIIQLIPEKEKPASRLDKVQDYIDGNRNVVPSTEKGLEFLSITQEIYYLLADYYFKNNEHPKAIKFYMYDICVNPLRLDSWAGLALARMYQLEQKLNSTDLKLDVSLQKRSRAALRCFERSVDIEDAYGKLWMEYGSLSYQLHTHSSRQLHFHEEKKQECDEDYLPTELRQVAVGFRLEMLELAYMCYKSASQCVDEESEEWLTDYMMGKCLEKMHKAPKEYLNFYRQALAALHEENATYPKKITYAYTAHTSPRLAVEALEMFYRLHVSILKLLLNGDHSEEFHDYAEYIEQAANSPFAKGCEKKDEESGNVSIDHSDPKSDKTTTNQQDHTYSKVNEITNMMENVTDNPANADSADSLDEKMEDSANSRDSSMYFPSAEQSESSQDAIETMETDDSLFSSNLIKPSSETPKMLELAAEELEPESKSTDALSKQKSYGFIPSGDPSCAEPELKKDAEVIEIFSSPEPFDPKSQPKFFVPDTTHKGDSKDSDVARLEVPSSCTEQIIELEPTVKNTNEALLKDKTENDGVLQKMIVSKARDNPEVTNVAEESSANIQISKPDPVSDVKDNENKQLTATSKSTEIAEKSQESSSPVNIKQGHAEKELPKSAHTIPNNQTTEQRKNEEPCNNSNADGSVKKESTADNPVVTHTGGGGGGDADTAKTLEGGGQNSQPSKPVQTENKPKLEGAALRKDLIEKCMAALHLCLSRFPTHYKSTYRLAYVYFYSPYHKNLQYARDLLLGNPQWQSLSYMPAQGLFSERKSANFFQGTWRLPISEVERAGSFATHLNRAVLLLLKILSEQKDVPMLHHLHLQLNKTPDAEKKYLRDAERLHYSRLALDYCLSAIKNRLPDIREMQDREKAIKLLMETYKSYNYCISKMKSTVGPRVSNLLAATFKAVMKEEVLSDKPLLDQALKFCQLYHQQNAPQRQGAVRSSADTSQSDSSFFSPDRSLSNLFRPSGVPQSPVKVPQSPVKLPQSISLTSLQGKSPQSPLPSLQASPTKSQLPQSPVKLPQVASTLVPKLQKPVVQLTKLSMVHRNIPELSEKPAQKEDSQALKSLTGEQSKSSTGALNVKETTPGISAISFISSLIEEGINKTKKPKMELPAKSESVVDEPAIPLVSPVTPTFPDNLSCSGISPGLSKSTPPKPSLEISANSSPVSSEGVLKPSSSLPSQGLSKQSPAGSLSPVPNPHVFKTSPPGLGMRESKLSPKESIPRTLMSTSVPSLVVSKPSTQRSSQGSSKPSLHLSHPKKRPYVVEEVIEILSSDDESEAMDVTPLSKPSVATKQENQQQTSKDNARITENPKDQGSSALITSNVKTEKSASVANLNTGSNENDSKTDPQKESGKDDLTDIKDLPLLDPSTGLFVTDSDSQSSVYVANPENISFEDELMVEDD